MPTTRVRERACPRRSVREVESSIAGVRLGGKRSRLAALGFAPVGRTSIPRAADSYHWAMAFKKMVDRLIKPVEDLDRERLIEFCDARSLAALDGIEARRHVRVGGEVRSVRIVPRAGAPALEVTVSDGRGSVVGVFLGRRKIAGLSPGRRVAFEGVTARDGKRFLVFNPVYELLA